MSAETQPFSFIVDPELGHPATILTFARPEDYRISDIVMYESRQYHITHPEGIPSRYGQKDATLHSVTGTLHIVTESDNVTKDFRPVLLDGTLTYSLEADPETQLTLEFKQYVFCVYPTSIVEEIGTEHQDQA